ncbi:UrcA family protein [Phenylobacterium sp.]|jgi:UrcA family protein|uniref:UrcA family protein n=1 Tax=Phenylobacterium sp. TaxID=1871053 RepID=UPI002F3FC6E4
MSRFVVVAVAFIASAAAAPGWCEPLGRKPVEVMQVRVPVGDLDLNSRAGADTLIQRVTAAADRACGRSSSGGVTGQMEQRAHQVCKAQAVARAVAQVDASAVQVRYAQNRGAVKVRVAEARP